MSSFLEALEEQRWDDHRFYHHSRINQALHLLSATSFVCAYVLVFKSPVAVMTMSIREGPSDLVVDLLDPKRAESYARLR